MKKIKILQVTGSLNVGGIEKLVFSFYENLDKSKYQMDYLLFDDEKSDLEDKIKKMGGNIIRIINPRKNYIKYYFELKKILRKFGPYDVVHSHVLFNSGFVMRAAYKCKVPIRIAHSHDNLSSIKNNFIKRIYIKIMKRYLYKYSNKFCACSTLAGYYMFGKDFFDKKGIIIYNSINLEKFKYDEEKRNKIRKELNIKQNEIVVGNIGRVVEQKNQKFIIELAKKMPEIKFIVVGDGDLLNHLKKECKKINIENQIIFTGVRNDVSSLLSSFDLFILPSVHEGLGIVLIEAQANGLPCVAPENVVPFEAKILDDFIFANFPSIENIDNWCNNINSLINNKRSNIKDYSASFKKYSYNTLIKSLEELYKL